MTFLSLCSLDSFLLSHSLSFLLPGNLLSHIIVSFPLSNGFRGFLVSPCFLTPFFGRFLVVSFPSLMFVFLHFFLSYAIVPLLPFCYTNAFFCYVSFRSKSLHKTSPSSSHFLSLYLISPFSCRLLALPFWILPLHSSYFFILFYVLSLFRLYFIF